MLLVLIVSFYILLQGFRLLFGYRLENNKIIILLFHFLPIYKILVSDIKEIYSAGMLQTLLIPGLRFDSRIFEQRVVIVTKSRLINHVFLTPKNPDVFITEVKNRVRG